MIDRVATEPTHDRTLYFASAPSFAAWPATIDEPRRHFVVFLAADARGVPDDEITDLADKLLSQGAAYVSVWGPDCRRVHDAFDDALRRRLPDVDDALVMTTWHEEEELDSALWYAIVVACPQDAFLETCGSLLAIVVGDGWSDHVRRRLADPVRLNADVAR